MWTERSVASGDRPLNVAVGPPSGPPLVLLHGVTRRWQDFAPLLAPLAARWRVNALDFRGHGRSAPVAGKYLVADYARDALALLHELREPAVLYGHSLGAMVAAAAAAEAPALVRGAVLEDPPFETLGARIQETPFHAFFSGLRDVLAAVDSDVDEVARQLAEVRTPGAGGKAVRLGDVRDPASLRFSARCLLDMDPEVLAPIVGGRWLDGYDKPSILRRVRCPVLLIQADWTVGGMLPDGSAAEAASLLERCCLVKVPGVGHLIHWMAAQETLRLATSFLESL